MDANILKRSIKKKRGCGIQNKEVEKKENLHVKKKQQQNKTGDGKETCSESIAWNLTEIDLNVHCNECTWTEAVLTKDIDWEERFDTEDQNKGDPPTHLLRGLS